MLLKIVLCSLKTPLRVLRISFVICNCFCHINCMAGVKITTAGRIITWQSPHSGFSVHHLHILHECADFTCLLKIIKLRSRKGFRSHVGNALRWDVFVSLNKGIPSYLFSPRGLTMDWHIWLFATQLDGPHIHTDQYPQHNGRMLSYALPQWPAAGDTH